MRKPLPVLSCLALLALCFTLAVLLESWQAQWLSAGRQSGGLLLAFMGDSRRLFANHFFIKADAYYHVGYYPSIFDARDNDGSVAMASEAGLQHEHDEQACVYLGHSLDWLDRFSRHFYPSEHVHADNHSAGTEREMLPWLRLSAELDPQRVETYTVAAFWLRTRLGKPRQAEQFLREGLRANPGNPEILYELGRAVYASGNDNFRARNIWELALRKWDEREAGKVEPNIFLRQQILGQLVLLEEKEQHWTRAIALLEELKKNSPNAKAVEKEIQELRIKASGTQPEGEVKKTH